MLGGLGTHDTCKSYESTGTTGDAKALHDPPGFSGTLPIYIITLI